MNDLIIFGAGGHAREVAQLVADINLVQPGRWQLLGFVADHQAIACHDKPLPAPILGDASYLLQHPNAQLVVAVGSPTARYSIVQRLQQLQPDLVFATLVHPRAWLAQRVSLGQGSVVFAGALINVDVKLGAHSSINLGCTISHDCALDDCVSLGPGVHLAGGVHVGCNTYISTGASLRPGIKLGAGVVIGAGAVVVHDQPNGMVAAGVPARAMPQSPEQPL